MDNMFSKWSFASFMALLASNSSATDTFFSAESYSQMRVLPASTLVAPSALVGTRGSVFVALGGLRNIDTNTTDGSLAMGMGFGNPIESIGGTASLTFGSINDDSGFGERVALNASIGSFFVEDQIGLTVGAINLASHNRLTDTPDPSFYAGLTKIFPISRHPIILNIGLGTNGFVDVNYTASNKSNNMSPFVSVAYYVGPHLSLIADYTAMVGSLGVSVSPIHTVPLSLTFAAYDISSESLNYTGALSYSFAY